MAEKPFVDHKQEQLEESSRVDEQFIQQIEKQFKEQNIDIDLKKNLRFKDQVGKYVKVKTVNSDEHLGWIKCLDPMSGNFFLIEIDDAVTRITSITLIMGDACKSSEVLQEPTKRVTALLANMDCSIEGISAAMIPDRKQRLLAWIKKNRLPVKEREDKTLVICDNVTVSPPYEVDNCASPNPRTLKSIRQLVEKLPSSIDEEAAKEAAKLAKRKEKSKARGLRKANLKHENLDQETSDEKRWDQDGWENPDKKSWDQDTLDEKRWDQDGWENPDKKRWDEGSWTQENSDQDSWDRETAEKKGWDQDDWENSDKKSWDQESSAQENLAKKTETVGDCQAATD